MKVLCLSMWFNDAGKHIADRAIHLLTKPGITRWVWSVRPGRDCTTESLVALADYANKRADEVGVYVEPEEQPEDRIERLSKAGDVLLSTVEDEDYVLWHESDLFTPDDLVERLAAVNAAAVGGWPLLSHDATKSLGIRTQKRMYLDQSIFYDTWGYRQGGVRFGNHAPYHKCYLPEPFPLDSVGSVTLIKADYIRRGARMNGGGMVGLCESILGLGGEVWCDPRVPVVQPTELWTLNND
jgi:hypothetical protein